MRRHFHFFIIGVFIAGAALFLRTEGNASFEDLLYHPKPSDFGLKEGDIIGARAYGDPDIFIINEFGYKRLFLNEAIFGMYGHLRYDGVKLVSKTVRDAFFTSVLFRNCETNSKSVWAIEVTGDDTALLHHIAMTGDQALAQDKRFFQKVFCINSKEEALYPKSPVDYTALNQIPGYIGAEKLPSRPPVPSRSFGPE